MAHIGDFVRDCYRGYLLRGILGSLDYSSYIYIYICTVRGFVVDRVLQRLYLGACAVYGPPLDRIWFWVYSNKIPIPHILSTKEGLYPDTTPYNPNIL